MSQASSSPTSGRSSRRLLLGAGLVAAAGGAGLAWWRHRPAPPLPGAQLDFWQEAFETPDGQPLRTSAWQGKPLLVNFWATWCPPCVEEMPLLDSFFQQNSSKGWQIVGIAIDQPSAVRRFLAAQPVHYPIALGGLNGNHLGRQLGNETGSLPYTLVLDAGGRVASQKLGRLDPQDLQKWI